VSLPKIAAGSRSLEASDAGRRKAMRYSRPDGEAGPGRPARSLPRLKRLGTYWAAFAYATVLVGGGIAGLALGYRTTGTIAVIFGGVCLLAGARDLARHWRAVSEGRTPDELQ
jgi:hypothetical protein